MICRLHSNSGCEQPNSQLLAPMCAHPAAEPYSLSQLCLASNIQVLADNGVAEFCRSVQTAHKVVGTLTMEQIWPT